MIIAKIGGLTIIDFLVQKVYNSDILQFRRRRLIMKTLVSALGLVVLSVFITACAGGPTAPSPSPSPVPPVVSTPVPPAVTPQPQPQPQPPATPSAVRITPEGATVPVGMEKIFTASGGDGRNYAFSAGPDNLILWEQVDYNMVKVQAIRTAGTGWIRVVGYDHGVVEKTINFTIK